VIEHANSAILSADGAEALLLGVFNAEEGSFY
jgi:hypothetical protein